MPIRVRLTFWYAALLAAVLVAVALFVTLRLKADLVADSDHRLNDAGAELARAYRVEGPSEFHDVSGSVLPHGDALAQVLDARGAVVTAHGGDAAKQPMVGDGDFAAARAGAERRVTVEVGEPPTHYRADLRPVDRRGRRYVVVTAESLAPAERSVHRVVILFLIGGPAALLLTAAGGWWLARKALLPVERMTEQADRMGAESLDRRLEIPRTEDEVARLARTLNAMLERLQRGVEDKRRLIADASHELRGPLTVMRSELDVALGDPDLDGAARAVLESSRDEVDRMARMVGDMLTLATIDEGRLELVKKPVDLRELAETVATRRGVAADGDSAWAVGDAMRLDQALANLIDNALKFGGGGPVEVHAGTGGGEARVTVTDHGPGIPAEERERIFERYVRLDSARGRGGSGLGLAICREVARAHGGRVWVEPGPDGGSRFVLALPLASRQSLPTANRRLPTPTA
jgi:heavy metal sensor kinase